MEYVILGNGIAGISAAEAIRQIDAEGNITMISDEKGVPYCRPMISLLLEGAIRASQLCIRDEGFHDRVRIKPVLGARVAAIDLDNQSVAVSGGQTIGYDRLLIATGADPRPIKAKGLYLKNIFFMRNKGQVQEMLSVLATAKRALVLGGGLVGFKAAYGLMRRGLQVTMLVRSGYPLSMQVDARAGKIILEELKRHGLEVKVKAHVTAFEGSRTVERALLSDGSEIPCDMVVIGKGVLPSLDFIPRDRIQVDLGVLVNAHMQSSVPGIFAAGDVAEFVDISRQARWVNAIWPEAVTQGRIAGMNMGGRAVAYKGSLGRNVIRIFGLDVMTGGLVNPPIDARYEVLNVHDPLRRTYRKLVFRYDKLIGMVLVNDIEQGGVLLSLIQSEAPIRIPKEKLLDRSFNYRQVLPVRQRAYSG
jgi:NAD(P)H-nitrite reductase large subunit